MYYDTQADAGRKKTDVYYQYSANDGVTWSTVEKITQAKRMKPRQVLIQETSMEIITAFHFMQIMPDRFARRRFLYVTGHLLRL